MTCSKIVGFSSAKQVMIFCFFFLKSVGGGDLQKRIKKITARFAAKSPTVFLQLHNSTGLDLSKY